MPTSFSFSPSGEVAAALERVFGAARWVHNRGMIAQWTAMRDGKSPLSLEELVESCITESSQKEEFSWLKIAPFEVLVDELDCLEDNLNELRGITSVRALPLKTKKDTQEVIYPRGSFSLRWNKQDVRILTLERTGEVEVYSADLKTELFPAADAVRINRGIDWKYSATVYFGNED